MIAMMGDSGVTGPRVQLTSTTASRLSGAGITTVTYQVASDGSVNKTNASGTLAFFETWLLSGLNSDYQVQATVSSGSVSGSATGTWLACSSSQSWSVSDTVLDANDVAATITVSIRDASTTTVLATATITLDAQRTS